MLQMLEIDWPTSPGRNYVVNFQTYFAFDDKGGRGYRLQRILRRKADGDVLVHEKYLHGHGVSKKVQDFGDQMRRSEESEESSDNYGWQQTAAQCGHCLLYTSPSPRDS